MILAADPDAAAGNISGHQILNHSFSRPLLSFLCDRQIIFPLSTGCLSASVFLFPAYLIMGTAHLSAATSQKVKKCNVLVNKLAFVLPVDVFDAFCKRNVGKRFLKRVAQCTMRTETTIRKLLSGVGPAKH